MYLINQIIKHLRQIYWAFMKRQKFASEKEEY